MNRISHLDGLRGIAIILVLMFHAYTRWAEFVPYGDSYSQFPLFYYGYLGVQLFFLISGFVILMTLEKCDNIRNFVYRRWLRLFPGMLICSLIVLVTAGLFQNRPSGQPQLLDILPGISFIDPYIWFKATGLELNSLEGSFWSLYVEFKFYIIAAILYFALGSKNLVYTLFACFISWFLASQLSGYNSIAMISAAHSITDILSFEYFGWFAAGAAYYMYTKNNETHWLATGVVFSIVSSMVESNLETGPLLATILVSLLFYLSITNNTVQSLMSNKFFLFLGFVSYPLYLLHENMMISITITLDNYLHMLPSFFYPIIAITFICLIAYVIAKKLEYIVKKSIVNLLTRKQELKQA